MTTAPRTPGDGIALIARAADLAARRRAGFRSFNPALAASDRAVREARGGV